MEYIRVIFHTGRWANYFQTIGGEKNILEIHHKLIAGCNCILYVDDVFDERTEQARTANEIVEIETDRIEV